METCAGCGRRLRNDAVQWREVLVCKQTHSSPAEYDRRPYCRTCGTEDAYDAQYEKAAAKYDGAHGEPDWR